MQIIGKTADYRPIISASLTNVHLFQLLELMQLMQVFVAEFG